MILVAAPASDSIGLNPFLIGRMFVREPNWDEAIFRVQKVSLNMFWEHSPYSTNIASVWLRAELSCG